MLNNPPSPKGVNRVGSFIKAARQRRGMTLRDVGALARTRGLSLSYEGFRKVEIGAVTPSDSTLRKIATVLDLDLDTLARISRESYVTNQFGRASLQALSISPHMYELNGLWKQLTPQQRKTMLQNLRHMAEFNLLNESRKKA